ncbi:DUF1553 domain-containing protein [Lacipirellula sp.]|uniref:DUF1553 domain-containing protein n=1 Tax=Lacipirellula sp. TaxID=2691419 RepID=UPI003D116909
MEQRRSHFVLLCSSLAFLAVLNTSISAAHSTDEQLARQAQRLLSDRCFKCHGPDEAAREGGLRLDLRDAARSELPSGAIAIVPGDESASALIERITAQDESLKMPPPESGKTLSPQEIDLLKKWVAQGAPHVSHWAFVKPVRPELPLIDGKNIPNPIDAFVQAQLAEHNLSPAPAASRERLIRRMTFDLIGLPPTPAEIDAFVANESSDAARQLFNRLTESPHYGERMAADWLDLARYADSNGYQNDFARQSWPWRDWVIAAFNGNMPYDQFLTEQLAGDLLPDATPSQKLATGFNRNHRTVTEAGSIDEEWRVENVVDRVETTSTAALGLTMGCARCHDHRYDPISQREFYQFYAFFNSVDEKGVNTEQRGNVAPLMTVQTADDQRRIDEFERTIARLEAKLETEQPAIQQAFAQWRTKLEKPADAPAASVSIPLEENAVVRKPDGTSISPANTTALPAFNADGSALSATFKGQEVAEYADLVELDARTPFSFSAFVKLTGQGTLFSQMDDRADFRGADLVVLEDDRLACHLIHRWPDESIKILARERPPKNKWFHVAVTYDGSSNACGVKLYVNGKPAAVDVERDSLRHNFAVAQPLRLGRRLVERPLDGQLRGATFFSEALHGKSIQATIASQLAELNTRGASLGDHGLALLRDLYLGSSTEEAADQFQQTEASLIANRADRDAFKSKLPTAMIMQELAAPRATFVLKRGVYDQPDAQPSVTPDVPAFLPRLAEGAPRNRLGLAAWVVSPENPLTARVAVNRLWKQFFGVGLVKTVENFGVQAEPPSHPELLDWLAVELVESGWDLQRLQWLIVSSDTYQQSSDAPHDSYANDPENRLLSRGPRFRLSAEMIRDNALAVSGLMNLKVGGASVMPYQPLGLWEELAGGAHEDYVQVHGSDLYRRSLYVYRKRTVPHPSLATFDAPSWEICQARRSSTNTPLQSLALLNDVTYVEAARQLATRMLAAEAGDDSRRVAYGFRLAAGREPRPQESAELLAALQEYRRAMSGDPAAAESMIAHGESTVATGVATEELAAHTLLSGILLNLDETITKN